MPAAQLGKPRPLLRAQGLIPPGVLPAGSDDRQRDGDLHLRSVDPDVAGALERTLGLLKGNEENRPYIDGVLRAGMKIRLMAKGQEYEVDQVGVFSPKPVAVAAKSRAR